MALHFQCSCGKSLRADPALAGQRTRCPACGTVLTIPQPPPVKADSPSEESYLLENPSPSQRDSGPWTPAPTRSESQPSAWHATPGRPQGAARPQAARSRVASSSTSAREFLYLILALALVPLGFSLLAKEDVSVKDRFEQAMDRAGPEVVDRVKKLVESNENASFDDLLAALPGGRLDDRAHLPRKTAVHWLYAGLAAGGFWALFVCLFPGEKKTPIHLLLVGLATGTLGIVLLLGFQFLAGATQGVWIRGRGVITVLFYIAKFIGWSYASASDPDSNFLLSVIGFICGVGLCEELCKALPLLVYFRRDVQMGWRGACLWGLASGAGFGVSEGIMYSANHYNGVSPAGIYVVRFVSCVALHALWCGSVGITLWRRQETIQGDLDWTGYSLAVLRILAVPMVLHGLYDTLLKKDMNAYALLVGLVSFAWFAWQVESARGQTAEDSSPGWAHAKG
jgi:RsiW-degrading membrane proteinase PrsW (M82 family)